MYENFILLLVFLVASIITFFLTKRNYSKTSKNIDNDQHDKIKEELITLQTKYSEKEDQYKKIIDDYKNLEKENNELKKQNTILETQKIELDKTINNRKEDLEEIKNYYPMNSKT